MMNVYPLRPVITTNPSLPQRYNAHPTSVFYTSACLTPTEAEDLLAQGAVFEVMVLDDGVGERLTELVSHRGSPDDEGHTQILRMTLPLQADEAVKALHEHFRTLPRTVRFFPMIGG